MSLGSYVTATNNSSVAPQTSHPADTSSARKVAAESPKPLSLNPKPV